MDQTPIHEIHNEDVLRLIPRSARRIIEIGCSSGALAREYKKINPDSLYIGVEIDAEYAQQAKRHCDTVYTLNIESAEESELRERLSGDCWIFGDVLEHLVDPWALLRRVRSVLSPGGSLIACVPNAQHWSVQARLNSGLFRYEPLGLLDRTHLRWFTRITLVEMFDETGFQVVEALARVPVDSGAEKVLPAIRQMAAAVGTDPDTAVRDSLVFQYIMRVIPKTDG